MKRYGSVLGIPKADWAEYERYHSAVWPSVLEQLKKSHIHNFSIFRQGEVLFCYFEYTGSDYEADMAAMDADPEIQRWYSLQMPLQRPLEERAEGEWWMKIKEVFHSD
jgi:L-rhamnose mutarotase